MRPVGRFALVRGLPPRRHESTHERGEFFPKKNCAGKPLENGESEELIVRRNFVRKQRKKSCGLMGDDLFWDKTAPLVISGSELTLAG